eukprot:COSAG02_NODE_335_length_24359_cov_282.817354_3_plen_73_part_00
MEAWQIDRGIECNPNPDQRPCRYAYDATGTIPVHRDYMYRTSPVSAHAGDTGKVVRSTFTEQVQAPSTAGAK